MYIDICTYIYNYTHIYIYIYIYTHIHICSEAGALLENAAPRPRAARHALWQPAALLSVHGPQPFTARRFAQGVFCTRPAWRLKGFGSLLCNNRRQTSYFNHTNNTTTTHVFYAWLMKSTSDHSIYIWGVVGQAKL